MVHHNVSLDRCGACEAFFIYEGSEGGCCISVGKSTTNIAVCDKCGNECNELQVRIRLLTREEADNYSGLGHNSEEHTVYLENYRNAFGDSEKFLIPAFMRRKVAGHAEYENKIKSLRKSFVENISIAYR